MGRGYVKAKNNLKKQYLAPLRKYAEQLEKENHALKNDPQTVIGQFIGQYRELYGQNQRLSVLAAVLIKKLGDSVKVGKEEMAAFENKLINIKWEIGDNETIETATEFTFSYDLKDAPPQGMPVQQTEDPGQIAECSDPNCTLPKDLKHRHTTDNPVVPVGETLTDGTEDLSMEEVLADAPLEHECNDPDCPASENGPHIHEARTA